MYLRINAVLCCAILVGFATAAQKNQPHNSDITFSDSDDGDVEGSGSDGEVAHDLESSGSGYGPDDEDTPIEPHVNLPKIKQTVDTPQTPNVNVPPIELPSPTELPKENTRILTDDTGVIMNPKTEERQTSFFAQPGILAAVIGGAVVGLLCAILVVMFIVYRMRKKDEGSYSLGEPKPSPNSTAYNRGNGKEFYA